MILRGIQPPPLLSSRPLSLYIGLAVDQDPHSWTLPIGPISTTTAWHTVPTSSQLPQQSGMDTPTQSALLHSVTTRPPSLSPSPPPSGGLNESDDWAAEDPLGTPDLHSPHSIQSNEQGATSPNLAWAPNPGSTTWNRNDICSLTALDINGPCGPLSN